MDRNRPADDGGINHGKPKFAPSRRPWNIPFPGYRSSRSGVSLPRQWRRTFLYSIGSRFLRLKKAIRGCPAHRGRVHRDFRVAPNDDRVGVMPRMAPSPGCGFAQNHERSHFIDNIVHPSRFEGGAMTAFMPARIRAGTIEHAINYEGRHAQPGSPEMPAEPAGEAQ